MSYYEYSGDLNAALLARTLGQHPDFRILTRLPWREEIWLYPTPAEGPALTLAVIDVETTGTDPETNSMIELAVVLLKLDAEGRLIDITAPLSMLEQPQNPLSAEIEALTGITDRMLAGQCFDTRLLQAILADVDAILCHNVPFDRAFLTARFDWLDLPWACTLHDIDWRQSGLEGRALGHLLASAGHFADDAHRAGDDAWALACLLARTDCDGRTIAAQLVDYARRPVLRLLATNAPFDLRATLKSAGYRWNVKQRAWWIEGDDEMIKRELVFLRSLHPRIAPTIEQVDWSNRYSI